MAPRDLPGARPASRRDARFRADVEGLRAVAVVAVLLYHAGVGWFRGGYVGVDVFFVISGYLITGLLLREIDATGTISATRFYGRRARRLLPTLALVLVTTSVLAWLLFEPLRRASAYLDIIASGVSAVNWWLAARTSGYAAVGSSVSPVQHIWSLAVEEQFYLVWPLLMLAVTWWRRRRGRPVGTVLLVALLVVTASSFLYCVHLTATDADLAFYSTPARAWELGVGGLLAVLSALLRRGPGRRTAVLLWLAGMAAIGFAIVRFSDSTLFPGVAAAVPVLGTAAVIAAGAGLRGGEAWPGRVLTLRPVRHVGRISYTWYLWHWPLLVFADAVWGPLRPPFGVLVVVAAYVPTILTHRLVEERFRRSEKLIRIPGYALRLGLACTVVATGTAVALHQATPRLSAASPGLARGAKALQGSSGIEQTVSGVLPTPAKAAQDWGRVHDDGCLVPKRKAHPATCVYGDRTSSTTVVLFGDSHAVQWAPALLPVARRRHWKVVVLTKAGCPPAAVHIFDSGLRREYRECDTWRPQALARIRGLHPDLVVLSSLTDYTIVQDGTRLGSAASQRALRAGYRQVLDQLSAESGRVAAIGDTPHHMDRVDDCVAAHPHDLTTCAVPQATAQAPQPLLDAAGDVAQVQTIDPTGRFCLHRTCPAVIGNVLVYRLVSHVTATYAATLDDWLGRRLPALRN